MNQRSIKICNLWVRQHGQSPRDSSRRDIHNVDVFSCSAFQPRGRKLIADHPKTARTGEAAIALAERLRDSKAGASRSLGPHVVLWLAARTPIRASRVSWLKSCSLNTDDARPGLAVFLRAVLSSAGFAGGRAFCRLTWPVRRLSRERHAPGVAPKVKSPDPRRADAP